MFVVISTTWSSTEFYFGTITLSYTHKYLSDKWQSTAKLSAYDASLFLTVYDPNI